MASTSCTTIKNNPGVASRRATILDMPFDAVTFREAIELLIELARGDKPTYAVTANVDHVMRYHRCPEVRHLYRNADLVVADGTPLVWATRLLGRPLPERVAGSDLFPALCAAAAGNDLTVFFMGGAPGTAEKAADILQTRHPGLQVVGTCCPPYGFEHDPEESLRVVEQIKCAHPDILFVGLGSPKQENWIVANRHACGVKLSIGVGISFSFVSGHVGRAPVWMRRAGLEWMHRLFQEPGRLWKRYLVEDPAFFALVLKYMLRRRSTASEGPAVD